MVKAQENVKLCRAKQLRTVRYGGSVREACVSRVVGENDEEQPKDTYNHATRKLYRCSTGPTDCLLGKCLCKDGYCAGSGPSVLELRSLMEH